MSLDRPSGPLRDPANNFTLPNTDAGGMPVNEYLLRQILSWAYKRIHEQVDRPDFRLFKMLYKRYGEPVITQMRTFVREHPNVSFVCNFPRQDMSLPIIACVNGVEKESGDTYLGDFIGERIPGPRTNKETNQQEFASLLTGCPLNCATNIYVMADDPNLTIFLSQLVRYILFVNKLQMERNYSLKNLVIDMQDQKWDETFLPTFCYIRLVQARYDSDMGLESDPLVRLTVATTFAVDDQESQGLPIPPTP